MSRSIDGFFFGRYDIRGETTAEIQAGRFKVIELNGVSSEATNIYDPRGTLRAAYGSLFRQWELAFRIGAANRALGARATPALPLLGRLFQHFRPSGARWVGAAAQSTDPSPSGKPGGTTSPLSTPPPHR